MSPTQLVGCFSLFVIKRRGIAGFIIYTEIIRRAVLATSKDPGVADNGVPNVVIRHTCGSIELL